MWYIPKTVTDVVPSPTSSSCTFDMSTKILAAGLSTPMDFKIVAPSLVTSTYKINQINNLKKPLSVIKKIKINQSVFTWPAFLPQDTRILSIPLGPKVLLTKSPIAIAPMKLDIRANSDFSSSASFFKILMGFSDTCTIISCDQDTRATRTTVRTFLDYSRFLWNFAYWNIAKCWQ